MSFIKNIWNVWWNQWTLYPKIVSIGALFLILLALWLFFRGGSTPTINNEQIRQQQDAIQKRNDEQLSNTLQKSNEVLSNVDNSVKQAEANTKEAVNKDFTNTSLTEAEKARCRAYPSSRGCPK